ncbi:MAG TPA: hypothetical protein VFQ44_17435 [Streptosporangiaceae bacterium]|nr:hypothetical protein [Streptosporangiaceae bacterium]
MTKLSLIEALMASIQRNQAAVAVVQGRASYTFSQLDQISAAMAGGSSAGWTAGSGRSSRGNPGTGDRG